MTQIAAQSSHVKLGGGDEEVQFIYIHTYCCIDIGLNKNFELRGSVTQTV